jgi:hypothetical protein
MKNQPNSLDFPRLRSSIIPGVSKRMRRESGLFNSMFNKKMTPRPTDYKGVRFRSKTEAVYARMFDMLGWPWNYEPEIPGWTHNPDFIVGCRRNGGQVELTIMEVKPKRPSKAYLASIEKAAKSFCGLRCGALVVYGNPWDGGEMMSIRMRRDGWGDPDEAPGFMQLLVEASEYRFDLESPETH